MNEIRASLTVGLAFLIGSTPVAANTMHDTYFVVSLGQIFVAQVAGFGLLLILLVVASGLGSTRGQDRRRLLIGVFLVGSALSVFPALFIRFGPGWSAGDTLDALVWLNRAGTAGVLLELLALAYAATLVVSALIARKRR